MGSKRKRGAKGVSNENQPSRKKAKNGAPQAAPVSSNLDLDKSPFSEKLANEDRKREAHIYELLGSYDSAEHIAAADALVTGLLSSEEAVLERHLEKRLFRGLASSRNASRVGFSLVLTELLGQLFGPQNLARTKFPSLTFDKVLGILLEKTEPSGNLPGQEERDFYFGQLFGLQCFVEAKVLFGDDNSRWPSILDLLLKLANKKVWLRSQCAWVIVVTLPQMGQDKAGETIQKLLDIGLGKTAEGVGIWLKAASCYPNLKMPSKPWISPLAPKSIPELANVLKENVKQDTGSQEVTALNAVASNWTAQLHFVWDLILAFFIDQPTTNKAPNTELFKVFWNTVIDDGLFSKSATEGQKFRGFMIFQKFIQAFTGRKGELFIKELFSRNLMKCLVNQAAKEDRYVHRAAVKSLKTIVTTVEAQPGTLLTIVTELLGKHGAYDFDQRTNSKTVEKLLQYSTEENIQDIFRKLRDPIALAEDGELAEIEKLRRIYADYIFKLGTQEKAPTGEGSPQDTRGETGGIVASAIGDLANCAYSNGGSSFTPELSEKTREYFRGRLESAFAKLTRRREDYHHLCNAVLSITPTAVQMSTDIETERKAALKALGKLVKSSEKSKNKEAEPYLGLALLYAITILQLYNGDPGALSTLADLKQCSEKMKEADTAASALLVEILLSLVSRPSSMMRQITQQVFEAFTAQLSDDALERLIAPLKAEENLKGQQALFDAEDEDMIDAKGTDESDDDEDDDEDEVSEIGSDVEFVTLNGIDPVAEEDEDEEGDATKTDADGDLEDALETLLRSHRLDKDNDAESSDDDSDMTDSEMMPLDVKLAEVFKGRTKKSNKKKENKDAKETIIIFKHRVLDFLDIYVKKEALNPLAFDLLLPLLQLVRTTTTKDLSNKAMKVITDFSEAFKKGRGDRNEPVVSVDVQLERLQVIHQEASQGDSHAFARAVSAASLLVASSLFSTRKDSVQQVAQVYASTQADWALGKIKMQPVLFSEWQNWCQGHASTAKM
ncbi:DNA polymerase phi-domain-containing protein [Xylariales sp. AK1849]|nr:DNA polymerase phi-domain-containing protein [Xylariales sp. AK1849]